MPTIIGYIIGYLELIKKLDKNASGCYIGNTN